MLSIFSTLSTKRLLNSKPNGTETVADVNLPVKIEYAKHLFLKINCGYCEQEKSLSGDELQTMTAHEIINSEMGIDFMGFSGRIFQESSKGCKKLRLVVMRLYIYIYIYISWLVL